MIVKGLLGVLAWAGVHGGWWWQEEFWRPRAAPEAHERWVDANHLEVEVAGRWRCVGLVPLADHLCRGNRPMFRRYCMPGSG